MGRVAGCHPACDAHAGGRPWSCALVVCPGVRVIFATRCCRTMPGRSRRCRPLAWSTWVGSQCRRFAGASGWRWNLIGAASSVLDRLRPAVAAGAGGRQRRRIGRRALGRRCSRSKAPCRATLRSPRRCAPTSRAGMHGLPAANTTQPAAGGWLRPTLQPSRALNLQSMPDP